MTKKKVDDQKAKNSHEKAWTELKEKFSNVEPELYSISGFYPVDMVIDHAHFGLGIVTASHHHKIEVCFKEGMKTLMHRREL